MGGDWECNFDYPLWIAMLVFFACGLIGAIRDAQY